LDQTHELEYTAVVRQALARYFELSLGFVIIQISTIKVSSARKVCLASIGPETKRCVDRSLSQTETTRTVVVAEDVK
jgi:hypothetical protein